MKPSNKKISSKRMRVVAYKTLNDPKATKREKHLAENILLRSRAKRSKLLV